MNEMYHSLETQTKPKSTTSNQSSSTLPKLLRRKARVRRAICSQYYKYNVTSDQAGGLYTPPPRMATLEFIRDILAERKRLIPVDQVRFVQQLERYDELSLARLLEFGHENCPEFNRYIPENAQIPKLSREYVANLINSLNPGAIERLRVGVIQRANNRNQPANQEARIELGQRFAAIFTNPVLPLANNRRLLGGLAHRPN